MAFHVQVASLAITETYLADFRLVWRCVVAHLRNVFDNTWMLAQISPAVVVDAVRAARLLDSVLDVRPRPLGVFELLLFEAHHSRRL